MTCNGNDDDFLNIKIYIYIVLNKRSHFIHFNPFVKLIFLVDVSGWFSPSLSLLANQPGQSLSSNWGGETWKKDESGDWLYVTYGPGPVRTSEGCTALTALTTLSLRYNLCRAGQGRAEQYQTFDHILLTFNPKISAKLPGHITIKENIFSLKISTVLLVFPS